MSPAPRPGYAPVVFDEMAFSEDVGRASASGANAALGDFCETPKSRIAEPSLESSSRPIPQDRGKATP